MNRKGRSYINSPNDRITFLVSSWGVDFAENEVGYLGGPPLHCHPLQDEIHYLIQGKLRYQIGDDIIDLESGEYLQIPGALPHAWINLQSEPARVVAIITPGGSEGFFKAATSAQLAPDALMQLAQRYGTEIVGPPLATGLGLLAASA